MQSSLRETRFYAACEAAVRATTAQKVALAHRLESLTQALAWEECAASPDGAFGALVAEIRAELERIHTELLADLGTFNVVLFGLTGVGKSTLIEALTQGGGETVSPEGILDWTKTVNGRGCGPLRVFDTPGFAGLKQQEMQDELEKARRAAASADVVVICFDNINQLRVEFETVARWIADYGKLAVAVLNVKDSHWRWPGEEDTGEQIAGHARHIREELARVGLPATPVVAVNAQNAMFARTCGMYFGPVPGQCAEYLKKFGAPGLDAISNFSSLEELLTKMVHCGGADLRVGSARRFTAKAVAQAATRLQDMGFWAERNAELAELTVAATLSLTGLPRAEAPDYEAFLRRLRKLEGLRGAAFEVPAVPRAVAFGQDLIGSRFRPLERDAVVRAREFVQQKLAERERPADGEFERAVYAHDQMETALSGIVADYQQFLRRSHNVLARDRYSVFKRENVRPPKVDAERGQWLFYTSVGLSAAGILAGFVLASNPIGWLVLGLILEGSGKRLMKEARADHERALAEALDSASGAVETAFAELARLTEAEFAQLRRMTLVSGAGTATGEARDWRELQHSCARAARLVWQFHPGHPKAAYHPVRLAWRAVEECEQDRKIRDAVGRDALWLGVERNRRHRTWPRWPRPDRPDVLSAVTAFGASLPAPVAPGAAEGWIAAVDRALGDDALTQELQALARREEPTVVFCGDYDSGKSSLIKRLLGPRADVPTSALPDTKRVRAYPYRHGLTLVDTPGFQATAARAANETTWTIATAAVVVLVFTPGLTACDPADLIRVLHGDAASHVPGRAARCLFIVNHADRLGVDPEYDPAGFAEIRELKLDQLRHDVPGLAHGVALSAVPFGALRPRSWDGVHEFAEGLAALRGRLGSDHGAVAVLTGGQIVLGRRYAELAGQLASLTPRIQRARSARGNAARLRAEADACCLDRQEELRLRVGRFIDDLIATALSTQSGARQDNRALRLEQLGDDPGFWDAVTQWAAETDRKVGGLEALCARQAAAGFERPVPRESFPGFEQVTDARLLASRDGSLAAQAVTWAGKAGAAAARAEKAEKAGRLATAGGKSAKLLKGAGPALGVLSGFASLALLCKELNDGIQDEEGRRKAVRALHQAGDEWARSALAADPAMARLGALYREVAAEEARQHTELDRLRNLARLLDDRAAACVALSARATELLGGNPTEAQ